MTYLLVVLAVLSRFLPHPWNFSPVFGALLFGGAYLKKRDCLWFPLALLAASDILLTTQIYGMQMQWTQGLVWSGFAVVGLIGRWLRPRVSVRTVLAASLAGPTAFFLISNFAVWLGGRLYPPTGEGFVACYVAALPFFRNSLLSSLLFSGVFFATYKLYRRKFVVPRLQNSVASHD